MKQNRIIKKLFLKELFSLYSGKSVIGKRLKMSPLGCEVNYIFWGSSLKPRAKNIGKIAQVKKKLSPPAKHWVTAVQLPPSIADFKT